MLLHIHLTLMRYNFNTTVKASMPSIAGAEAAEDFFTKKKKQILNKN